MPELPEITCRAREMQEALTGRSVVAIGVVQPKCLNVPADAFEQALVGARWLEVTCRGKWIVARTTGPWFLLNLGMGGELLLVPSDALPEKRRLHLAFDERESLSVNFWWFGYAHVAAPDALAAHTMTAKLGPNADQVTRDGLRALLAGRRGAIKSFLLDQSHLAGIGNAYVHDILFLAGLHPLRTIDTLTAADIDRLADAIHEGLQHSIDKGGAHYETSIRGEPGGFTFDDILVGYKDGKPCPTCATPVQKIKTGSTSSFVCPACQPLAPGGRSRQALP